MDSKQICLLPAFVTHLQHLSCLCVYAYVSLQPHQSPELPPYSPVQVLVLPQEVELENVSWAKRSQRLDLPQFKKRAKG